METLCRSLFRAVYGMDNAIRAGDYENIFKCLIEKEITSDTIISYGIYGRICL